VVATHLLHFHFRGAQPSVAAESATTGWAQGAFYGPYLGSGASESTTGESGTAGWAQGAFYGFYYGGGVQIISAPGGGAKSYAYPREYPRREDDELLETAKLCAIMLSTRKIR
jgi:hypothetical protein